MMNEITVAYNAQITRVIKPIDKSEAKRIEAQLMNKDLNVLGDYIKSRLGVDDVKVREFKIFINDSK